MSAVRKQQTPPLDLCLSGQVFFISTQVTKLEPLAHNIGLLGGKVEVFFSKDVTSLLVDDCCLNEYYFLAGDLRVNGFPEEKTHLLPKICGPGPVLPCTSRGYTLLSSATNSQISNSETSAFRVIQRAKQLGINVSGIRQFSSFIEKRLVVIPSNPRKRKPAVQKIKLLGCFVKVEDFAKKYKTFYKILTEDPVRYLPVKPITFVHNRLISQQHSFFVSPHNSLVHKPVAHDNSPEIIPLHEKSKITPIRQTKNISNAKATPKSKKRTNHFCECCNVYFSDFSQHIFGEKHQMFVSDRRNYSCVDDILKTLPSIQDFMKKHSNIQDPPINTEPLSVNDLPIDYTLPKINDLVNESEKMVNVPAVKPLVNIGSNFISKLPNQNYFEVASTPIKLNQDVVPELSKIIKEDVLEKDALSLKNFPPVDNVQNRGEWCSIDFDMDFDNWFDTCNNGDFDKELFEEKFREFSEHVAKNVLAEGEKEMPTLSVFSPNKTALPIPKEQPIIESSHSVTNKGIVQSLDSTSQTMNHNSPPNLGPPNLTFQNSFLPSAETPCLNNRPTKTENLEFNKMNLSKADKMFSDDSSEGNICQNNIISDVLTIINNSDKKSEEKSKIAEKISPKNTDSHNQKSRKTTSHKISTKSISRNSKKSQKLSSLWSVCTLPSNSIRLKFTCLKRETSENKSTDDDIAPASSKSNDSYNFSIKQMEVS